MYIVYVERRCTYRWLLVIYLKNVSFLTSLNFYTIFSTYLKNIPYKYFYGERVLKLYYILN